MPSWIKVDSSLLTKPEVFHIAELTGMSRYEVVGRLISVWVWADEQSRDGNATSVTEAHLDELHGVTGFAQAMAEAGWLKVTNAGISIPNFDRHISQSAKARALTAIRAQRSRNARTVTKALPEKRREEKKNTPLIPPVGNRTAWDAACAAMTGERLQTDAFRAAWESWSRDRRARGLALTDEAIALQIRDMESWGPHRAIAAIELTIAKGWKGLREAEGVGDGKPTVQPGQNRQDADRIHREAIEADRRAEIVKRLYATLDPGEAKAAYAKWKASQPGGVRKWLPDDPSQRQETVVELMRPGAIARELEENAT